MANPRFFQDTDLPINQTIPLSDDVFGHAIRVLRLNNGDTITLFNGKTSNNIKDSIPDDINHFIDVEAELINVGKKSADVRLISQKIIKNESKLNIHLGQGISRGDRMDFTLQKSVELGVNSITPLFTERCGVKLKGERLDKKREQWQKIVISACEQSGRCSIPIVNEPITLEEWLAQETTALKINLHPKAHHSIMSLPVENNRVRLLIGPEGGLNDEEIQQANTAGFTDVLLGPRVLRTETAALTAITALQCRYGDLA